MADVYRIGVAIGMTDNATQVLQTLASKVLGLNMAAKDLERGLNRAKLAAVGLVGVLGGSAILHGVNSMAEAGAKLQRAQTAMLQAGMTQKQIAQETAVAYNSMNQVRGPDIVDRVNAIRELRGIVGTGPNGNDYREVNAVLPNYLRVRSLYGEHGSQEIFRTIEMQGGARYDDKGNFDEARFAQYLDASLRTLQASGGNLKPQDLLNVMQMGAVTARGMTPDAFWNMMMTPAMEMRGYRAGTAVTAMSRVFYGGIMPDHNARELERLGILSGGSIKKMGYLTPEQRADLKAHGYHVGRGGVVTVRRDGVKGADELNDPNRGFFPWIRDVLAPAIRHDYDTNIATRPGNTETYDAFVRREILEALPTETARRFSALMVQQITSVERDATLRQQATGIGAYDLAQQNYTQQLENMRHSWASLMETLGLPAAQDGAHLLQSISHGLDTLTQAAAKSPEATRMIIRLAAAIGAVAVVGGTIAVGVASLGMVATGLGALGAVAAGGSLIAAAAGITAVSTALVGLVGIAMLWKNQDQLKADHAAQLKAHPEMQAPKYFDAPYELSDFNPFKWMQHHRARRPLWREADPEYHAQFGRDELNRQLGIDGYTPTKPGPRQVSNENVPIIDRLNAARVFPENAGSTRRSDRTSNGATHSGYGTEQRTQSQTLHLTVPLTLDKRELGRAMLQINLDDARRANRAQSGAFDGLANAQVPGMSVGY
ncbi:hypothetical protein C0V97_03805 [Asaia sp. W19]|uniref:hypothetical protein n=1 Tax=unclassified Asaia TaxID=2685023 RepID=UPI000F8C4CB8|nr:hypothetical protein [Asaia sp. W19]RUT26946.1 hypothetical protein C0V97_03805 [Asaia sp. W19]